MLLISYFFYLSWDIRLILLLLYITVITYYGGIYIDKYNNNKNKKYVLVITIVLVLLPLLYFKYFNFILNSANKLFNLIHLSFNFPINKIALPIGISFITLQALTYPIDVYRKDVEVEKNFLKYALFVSFFTNIIAGPIERAKRLLP